MSAVARLQEHLGYRFADPGLLAWSLTHRSHTSELGEGEHNERLEFLGDAVLQLVVTDYLFSNYPLLAEGQMAKVRASCVSRPALARVARAVELGSALALGRGEELTGGGEKESILADAMEAVLAAVYLDGGLEVARQVVLAHWQELIHDRGENPGARDYKTRLQEVLAARGERPVYSVEEEGPDHDKTFSVRVAVRGVLLGEGVGGSKKAAEQAAAEQAMLGLSAD